MTAVGIYCGSQYGNNPVYREKATELGALIGERGLSLVYGGGKAGLMGVIAEAALSKGSRVISVLPAFIKDKVGLLEGSELVLTETMHERKKHIIDNSDGVIAFPGGIGTLDEFFEAYTWAQLGLLKKPVALLNINGFYDQLLLFLDHQVTEGFLKQVHRESLIVSDNAREILEIMASFKYNYSGKWTEKINSHP